MKWIFYIIVFVYMFYRTVYGVKVKDSQITLDRNDLKEGEYIEAGERKVVSCKASSKNQKIEWINPNGQVVSRLQSSRVFATQYFVQSMRSTGPSLVLTFSRTAVEDSGVWECRSGDITQNVSICVIDSMDFEGTPAEVTADEGRSFTLSCQAKGDPEPRISWYRNGDEISDDYTEEPKYRLMTKYNSQGIEGLLTVMSLTTEDSGIYTCNAIQESPLVDGCSNSDSFNITLNINHAPTFEEEDVKKKIYGSESEILLIKCEAEGYPEPTYRWFKKENEDLSEFSEKEIVNPENGTSSILQIKVTEDTYNKDYICRAINYLGEQERVFTILEPTKPEPPSKVVPIMAENSKTLIFDITWDDEIFFDIDVIEAQYFPAAQLKRRLKPREYDWKNIKKTLASVGDIEDFGTKAMLNDLEEATEYWVRLRIKNDLGMSPWSEPIKASTKNEEEKVEEDEEDQEEEVSTSSATPPTAEEDETSVSENDDLITTEGPPPPEGDSGKFYGLFFGVGVVLVIVACTFVMRMI